MYTPPAFQIDRTSSLAFAEANGFAMVVACDRGKPIASPLPFCLDYISDGTPVASFHVARNNPLARLADGASRWLLIVSGAHTYVSPHWYASPDQVPTWLYQTVHLGGVVTPTNDAQLAAHVDALSTHFEEGLAPKPVWTSAEMPAGRHEAMRKGIVGLTMAVDEVHGTFKLNQHKSDADHVAIVSALSQQGDHGVRELAATMYAMRPHAFALEQDCDRPDPVLEGAM